MLFHFYQFQQHFAPKKHICTKKKVKKRIKKAKHQVASKITKKKKKKKKRKHNIVLTVNSHLLGLGIKQACLVAGVHVLRAFLGVQVRVVPVPLHGRFLLLRGELVALQATGDDLRWLVVVVIIGCWRWCLPLPPPLFTMLGLGRCRRFLPGTALVPAGQLRHLCIIAVLLRKCILLHPTDLL